MVFTEIRDRRRVLRYRNLVVKEMVQMKNRVSGLLLDTDLSYNKQRLHKVGYFGEMMCTNAEHKSPRSYSAHRVRRNANKVIPSRPPRIDGNRTPHAVI